MKEKILNIIRTFQVVGPLVKNAMISGQLFHPQCELTEPDKDIVVDYDVKVPMSEGFTLTANVFRSEKSTKNGEKVPIVMCAHPYDNHLTPALGKTPLKGPPQQYRIIPQSGGIPKFSTITSWESPDPNFWVPNGYALVNLNLPGYANSEGPASTFSEHQAKCYYEAIEWFAKQPWCSGKVGLNGVSFLAITQYHVAACQVFGGPPPSLKCISPWEGLSDIYRDVWAYGGVYESGFPAFWWNTEVKPVLNGTEKDFEDFEGSIPTDWLRQHPLYDDFWKSKAAKVNEITIPMLVCAAFSDHGLHTLGSFRAFEKAQSKHKWVYTHRTGKWVSYYSEEVQNLTKDFMDCFLKDDTSNGFLDTLPVRLEVRSTRDKIHEIRHENEWPLARTQYTKLYLGKQANTLSTEQPKQSSEVEYSAKKGKALFTFKFTEDTELSGYMKLRAWVEIRPDKVGRTQPDDMTLFLAVNKLDRDGTSVYFYGSIGLDMDMVTRGWCKVSCRELDPVESTEWHPVQKGDSEHKLKVGEIVPVDVLLYPSSTFFEAGESLQLIVAGSEIIPTPPYRKSEDGNHGNYVLHFGGQYDSYLLIPEIPR